MNKKQQGNWAEIAVIKEFLKNDFKVSIPYGDNASYDLIIEDKSGQLYKVQVKSTSYEKRKNVYAFKTVKNRINTNQSFKVHYTQNEVDFFALYNIVLDEIYLLKYDEIDSEDTYIRTEKISNNSSKLSEDYILDKRIKELF